MNGWADLLVVARHWIDKGWLVEVGMAAGDRGRWRRELGVEGEGVLIAIQELINEYERGIWLPGNLTWLPATVRA